MSLIDRDFVGAVRGGFARFGLSTLSAGVVFISFGDQERRLLFYKRNISAYIMNILIMSAKITALSEISWAEIACIRSLCGMLAEVVSQVTALAESGHAALVFTAENQFRFRLG